jgi:hypothetical protein
MIITLPPDVVAVSVPPDRFGQCHRIHLARHDVIGQHLGQRRFVLGLEQRVDRARGQSGESRVGRREHRERAGALERVDQAGGLDRGDQRRVILRVDGVVDDVLVRIHRRATDHRRAAVRHRGVAHHRRARRQRGARGDKHERQGREFE